MNIGILISNKHGDTIGYTKKGFFITKESIFNIDFYKNNLSDDIIWFSNLEDEKLNLHPKIKSNNYFKTKLTDMAKYDGYYDVIEHKDRNIKILMIKLFDYIDIMLNNYIETFKNEDIERINRKIKIKRIKDRKEDIVNSKNYEELILKTIYRNKHKEKDLVKINKDTIIRNNKYKDGSTNELINILKNKELTPSDIKINNKRDNSVLIKTISKDKIKELENIEINRKSDYKITNIGKEFTVGKEDQELLEINDIIFYQIKIKSKTNNRIFDNLIGVSQWVSKSELSFYIENDFKLSMEYVIEKTNNNTLFVLNESQIDLFYSKNLEGIYLLNNIFSTNYLQIIEKNDNYIINKWIKSNLIYENLKTIYKLEKSDVEIINFSYDFIEISYNEKDKKRIRFLLENMGINYPAKLI